MTENISNDVSRKNNCPKLLTRALRCCIFAAEKHCGDTFPILGLGHTRRKTHDPLTCQLANSSTYIAITNLTKNDERN